MVKALSEMTRADWLTRRWIDTTPPGSPEMMFTDAGDFPLEQCAVLLQVLNAGLGPEAATVATGTADTPRASDQRVAR
jgi:hypothetical protein